MIIDIHTHTFPDAIAYKTIASMEEDIVRGQGIHVKCARIPTVKGLEDSTKKADLDLSVVCPVATNIRQPEKINRLSVEFNEKRDRQSKDNIGLQSSGKIYSSYGRTYYTMESHKRR